jgi:hypothetical protein
MNEYTFDVYYKYSRDHSNPVALPKSQLDVETAFSYFKSDVLRNLVDASATATDQPSPRYPSGRRVTFVTSSSRAQA